MIKQIREAQADRDREQIASRDRELRLHFEAERLEAQAKLASSRKLSAVELQKAEELASWDFIKDRQKIDKLRTHIKRFPESTTAQFALTQLEELMWRASSATGAELDLKSFADEFPNSVYAIEALSIIKSTRDTASAGVRYQRAQGTAFWRCVLFSVIAVLVPAAALVIVEWNSKAQIGIGVWFPFIVMLLVWWYYEDEPYDDTRAYWLHLSIAATWISLLSPWIGSALHTFSITETLPAKLTGAIFITLLLTGGIYSLFYFPMRRGSISNAGWARAFYIFFSILIGHIPVTVDGVLPEAVKGLHINISLIITFTLLATTSIDWDDDTNFYRVVSQRFVLASIAAFLVGVLASLAAGPWISLAWAAGVGTLGLVLFLPPWYDKAPIAKP